MPKTSEKEKLLPTTLFLVLALLAEKEAHGYELEQLVWNRGFRYWTDLKRSSIYNALKRLETQGFITSRLSEGGGGPIRKVFSITESGLERLRGDARQHLAYPAHPRSEIDLGIYSFPFLSRTEALEAVREGHLTLERRAKFLEERLTWCRERGLRLAALNFERPLLALKAELKWLEGLKKELQELPEDMPFDWRHYEYKEPPGSDYA